MVIWSFAKFFPVVLKKRRSNVFGGERCAARGEFAGGASEHRHRAPSFEHRQMSPSVRQGTSSQCQNSYLDLVVWYSICQLNKNISKYWDGNAVYWWPAAHASHRGGEPDWHNTLIHFWSFFGFIRLENPDLSVVLFGSIAASCLYRKLPHVFATHPEILFMMILYQSYHRIVTLMLYLCIYSMTTKGRCQKKNGKMWEFWKNRGGAYPNPTSIFYCFLHWRPPQKRS